MTQAAVVTHAAHRVSSDDPVTDAEYEMALANAGLIGFCIERFKVNVNNDYTFNDAWQDGWFGLVRACQKFDIERGYQFSTYAVWQIRSAIQKGRGFHEGTNFRRELRHNEEHIRPLSIDCDTGSPITTSIMERLADPSDVEAAAVASSSVAILHRFALTKCKDEIDHHVTAAMFDPENILNQREVIDQIARRFGVPSPAVRRRYRRIKDGLVRYSVKTGLAA